MAQYNANIQVTADFNAAEKALRDFETRFNKLAGGLDITKKVGRSFTEAFVPPKQLKQIDRELATIASRADTVAKRFARVVEGAGTLGVAAKGISDVGQVLENLSVSAQTVAANFNNANLATKVLVPGFNLAKETANNLAKSVSLLEYKFHALVPSADGISQALAAIGPEAGLAAGAIAAIGTAMETVLRGRAQELDKDLTATLRQINDQTQVLFRTLESLGQRVGGTARQFQNLLRAGEERLANVSAYSEEARRAMSTILTAEMRLTAELERQATLRREMQTSRFAAVASRTGMGFDFSQQRMLPAAGQTSFLGEVRGGIGGGARNPLSNYEMLIGASGRLAARTQDNVDQALRWAQATKEQVRLVSQIDYIMPGILAKSISLSRIKALPDSDMLQASARGLRTIETIEQGRIDRLERIRQKLQQIQQYVSEDEKGVPFPNLENFGGVQPTTGPFQARFGKQGPAVPPSGTARRSTRTGGGLGFNPEATAENLALGAGFPLLFGGGAGQVAGGLLGSFFGAGFGGQILGSAIGQQLEDAQKRIADIGNAIQSLDFNALRDSVITTNAELETTVRRLTEAGKVEAARAVLSEQVTRQTGLLPESVTTSRNAVTALNSAWSEFVAAISGALSLLGTPSINALSLILQGVTKVVQGFNFIVSILEKFAPLLNPITTVLNIIGNTILPKINEQEEARIAKLQAFIDKQNLELQNTNKIIALEAQRTLGRTAAEKQINIEIERRQGIEKINQEYAEKAKQIRVDNAGLEQDLINKALARNESAKQQALEQQRIKDLLAAQGLEIEANEARYNRAAEAVQQQIAALDRGNAVTQSRYSAEAALNDLYGVQLERQYELATTAQQRYDIALQLFNQQIQAAQIEYEQSLNNNKLLIEKAKLETNLVQIKYKQLEAEKQIAIAQAVARGNTPDQITSIVAAYDKGLAIQQEALQASYNQINATIELAHNQNIVADALFRSKTIQVESQLAQKLVSDEIGMSQQQANYLAGALGAGVIQGHNMAAAMGQVALQAQFAAQQMQNALTLQNMLRGGGNAEAGARRAAEGAYWSGGFKAFAEGGVVTKPTMGIVGEGGEPEYIIPASKMAEAMQRYASGQRGSSVIPSSINPQVSVTTGPVMNMGGTNFVSQQDFMMGMQTASRRGAEMAIQLLQGNNSVRRRAGVA